MIQQHFPETGPQLVSGIRPPPVLPDVPVNGIIIIWNPIATRVNPLTPPDLTPTSPDPLPQAEADDYDDEYAVPVDPAYGRPLGNYPADRGRLLLVGGGIYLIASTVLNVAFASVEAATASVFVIGGMALLALGIGWTILHRWNREVILYERGFSYHEGSRDVYFAYLEIKSIHQQAERIAYFGGLVRRVRHRITLMTTGGETIVLHDLYRRIDELGLKLEQQITRVLRPLIDGLMRDGKPVAFGEALVLTADGIRAGAQALAWGDFRDFSLSGGKLHLHGPTPEAAVSVPLAALDNVVLLLDILRERRVS